jgi:phenylpyruvate tautomerase PptA (4-oxalocrotonate tautomerase family)
MTATLCAQSFSITEKEFYLFKDIIYRHTGIQMTEKKRNLVTSLSNIVSQATGKPQQYVMATITDAQISMAGETGPAAFIDVRSIGSINKQVNQCISKEIKILLEKDFTISGDRIYINFTDVQAGNWGWNGSTFG